MRKILSAGIAVVGLFASGSPALARQGCGVGFHRGSYSGCRPNRGPGYARRGPVVGVFYPGRGYWYGNRYWRERYRWHGGWRYR
jgi:hypothetical protein